MADFRLVSAGKRSIVVRAMTGGDRFLAAPSQAAAKWFDEEK